jgi:NitT/TauT family transport system substrate-binding protein
VPQAQFAGYFAADQQGYYSAENLTVEFVPGGPNVIPQAVGSQPDGPEFTISWVPKVLEAREGGSDLVDIAQIFQRSGTLSVSWKDSAIDDPCKFAGKKVGVWDFGNEYEVTAGALACGLTPGLENNGDPSKQFQKVIQPFDMTLLLSRSIDVAEAMIYNEYAQVLEATNPETGELYKPEDLNVIDWNAQRVAMLQDAIFARKAWLDQEGNRDIAVRFVRASLKGWIYCRDHPDDCVKYTTDAGSQLPAGHQAWMMNEVNPLIWPSPLGVGVLDPVFYGQTVRISKNAGIIKNDPSPDAYDASIAKEALESLADMDTKGDNFQKGTVQVTPGGS